MLRYCVMLIDNKSSITLANDLKVVIASGLTSSHLEQRS